ncbi:MAG TPA: DUF3592 domain-containing protein [Coleofasciculaceae cyanobacterium]
MNIKRWLKLLWVKGFGILCVSFGGILLVQLPSFYESEVDFQSKAVSATGTVVKTREKTEYFGGGITPGTSTTKFISTVKFQTNQGELVEFTTTAACSSRRDCQNKKVAVLYDPILPLEARVDSGSTPEGKVKGSLVLSTLVLLFGINFIIVEPSDYSTKPLSKNK